MMPGGLTETKLATPEIQEIADQVKPQLEERENKTYPVFVAIKYKTQVVAGTNYFIKAVPFVTSARRLSLLGVCSYPVPSPVTEVRPIAAAHVAAVSAEGASPGGSQLDYDNVEEPALNDVPQTPDGRDAPALPGDGPGAVYDDAREVSVPEGDPGLGQNDDKGTGASDRDRDAQTGGSLHSRRSEGVSGMEKETLFLPLGDTGYDDVGHCDSGGSISEQCDWTK
ncbi:unnamed protein product [Caretta caretta]